MGKIDFANVHMTDTTIPYMEINGEKILFSTQDEVFLNSQCLFLEYADIIKSPYFNFVYMIMQHPNNFSENYVTEKFLGFDPPSLVEWYINRSYQNPLMDLIRPEALEHVPAKVLDEFLNNQIEQIPSVNYTAAWLNMADVVRQLSTEKASIVKKIIIWHPYENNAIKNDISSYFGPRVHFITGDLQECLRYVPDDSTYVFSDIMNIEVILAEGKLKHCSVLVPEDYRYNFTEENKLKIDYGNYLEEELFKFGLFNATMKTVNKNV